MSTDASLSPRDLATRLAAWATSFTLGETDEATARLALIDTLAVAAAAREHPQARLAAGLGPAGRIAMLAHVLDYDDLHIPSTSHISAVCVAVAVAGGGGEGYLASAGVMARLGTMLGWGHYDAGWHSTCTAGAPAAAAGAAIAAGLDESGVARAIALAVPAAGGVGASFGTSAKSLQVGFAADAGMRAAGLAAAGASVDTNALDQWLALVGGTRADVEPAPAIPGGLAVKLYPCCYALQRPIEAVRVALNGDSPSAKDVDRVTVRLPLDAMRPLIHARPRTGLEGKFSLEYAIAAAILDGFPGLASFSDEAVLRPSARQIVERVRTAPTAGRGGLLTGTVEVEIKLRGGRTATAEVTLPAGAPARPLTRQQLDGKLDQCALGRDRNAIACARWETAAEVVRELFEPRDMRRTFHGRRP
jgi:2-methylcitrate dehydratase PrpD